MTPHDAPPLKFEEGPERRPSWPTRAARATRVALGFLTVIPLGSGPSELAERDLADSRLAYPVAGALIGLVLAGLTEALRRLGVAAPLSAFAIVAAGVLLTGGLHLDGLADTFDGLFLGGGPERRLAVMRDPHIGSFGVAAIVLVLLGRSSALQALNPSRAAFAVFAAATVGRTLILVSAGMANYARREGTGQILIDATTRRDAIAGALVVLGIAVVTAGWSGLVAGIAALSLASILTWLASKRIGGITGDTLGALVELGELTFLVSLGVTG